MIKFRTILEVFLIALKLGVTSFGGPVAHLGYFREEYVVRRKWLDENSYAALVALCQFLPGPASSQVGISVGMTRAGMLGGIAAWIGFTLPSALALAVFAIALQDVDVANSGWLHGLMIVAVAIVAQAVWGMARSLAPDRPRATIAILTAIAALMIPNAFGQVALIILSGLAGLLFLRSKEEKQQTQLNFSVSRRAGVLSWGIFLALLFGLPLLSHWFAAPWLAMFDSFYRAGSLVFGGGHVVLPLLQAEVVPNGWVTDAEFIAGYGAAQAVPGPLFTFASYLGATMNGWQGAWVATLAIFLPSFLLVLGALPFWEAVRHRAGFQSFFQGVNAAVVGMLVATLYDPVWTKAILSPADFSLALLAFGLLMVWKIPPWIVVVVAATGGMIF